MQMNLRKCLLLVFVIINILMQAVIADPQAIEHPQNSTSSIQIPEFCNLHPNIGLCTECYRGRCFPFLSQYKRYAYNKYIDECVPYTYGGCGGNANNFKSRADCQATCPSLGRKVIVTASLMYVVIGHPQEILSQNFTSPTQDSKICNLHPDMSVCSECYRGSCHPILSKSKRYAYNKHKNECVPFLYGGCGGNANNFKSKADCEATCFSLERKKQIKYFTYKILDNIRKIVNLSHYDNYNSDYYQIM